MTALAMSFAPRGRLMVRWGSCRTLTEDPGAKPLNEATKYVASRSRPTLGWSNSVLIVVLGSGKRLFVEGTVPAGLKLVDSTVSTTGVVIGTYEPAGEILTGSFALD